MYQHSITPISLPCALRIPEKGQIAHLNIHLKRQLQIDSDSFVNWLSLMFQTWLENSRKCRMHQTPAQWPSSSNKEQVGHKIAFAPSISRRGTLTWCIGCSSHFSPAEAAWASYFSWVLVRQRICVFVNPDLLISFIIKLATCCTWTQWKRNRWRAPRLFVRQPSVLWLWAHVQPRRWFTSRCPLRESLSRTAKDGTW